MNVPSANAVALIKRRVAASFGVTVAEIDGKKRKRGIVVPRQTAMYLAQKATGHSTSVIGSLFGRRDHTTVIHAMLVTERRLAQDSTFREIVETILNEARKDQRISEGRIGELIEQIADKARAGIVERLTEIAALEPREVAERLAPQLFNPTGDDK